MTFGNDFLVAAVGWVAYGFTIGERVYGVKPPSRDGTHTSHVLVKPAHFRKAPANRKLQDPSALPLQLRHDVAGCGWGRRPP
jgi:reticulon-4-interacting protein 1, mitochondrial